MESVKKPGSSPGCGILLSELSGAFFFLCSHPLYFSYLVFFSPYLLKLVSFLSPLFVTTALLVLAFLGAVSPGIVGDRGVEELEVYKIVFDVSGAMLEVREGGAEVSEEVVKETCCEEVVDKCLIVHGAGDFDWPSSPERLKWCSEDESVELENVPSSKADAKVKPRDFDQLLPEKIKQLTPGVESLKWCLEDEKNESENAPLQSVDAEVEPRPFEPSSPVKIKQLIAGVESLKWCFEDEKTEPENVSFKSVDAKFKPRAFKPLAPANIKHLTTGVESRKWCLEDEKTEPVNAPSKTVDVKVKPRAFEQSSPVKIKQLTAGVESLKWCLEEETTGPANKPSKTVDAEVKPRVKGSEKVIQTQKEDLFTVDKSNAAESPEAEDHAYFASPQWELDAKTPKNPRSMGDSPMRGSNLSSRREKEWRRTLACKLFEDRHNAEGSAEGMDMLWETHESASNKKKGGSKNKKGEKGALDRSEDEEEFDDERNGQLCCLQALKFSAGKPSLVKFSKALKGMGWLHSVARHARRRYN